MRLLEILPSGDIRLTDNLLDDAIPRYAILSHRWGSEEVTYEDMIDGSGRSKTGYEKIQFCGEQAAQDGLRHFWVDSCCIKKSNDAELSESINSMFRWYQDAEKCYVYLSDVESTQGEWEQAFRASEWFRRGWTLQELLAPSSVEFFTRQKIRLGDKRSLEQHIHEVTGIPIPALRGSSELSQFSTGEKFDWAKRRQTTREEDWAYSLLGIFDISMPVIYGEGKANAVRRLRREIDHALKDKECLRHLYVTDPRSDKTRIEETKGGLLIESYRWILETSDFKQWRDGQSRLLWIKGDPGKGKTMLLCGIIDELKKSKSTTGTHILSYFFCQATDSRINNATAVLRGLLYLLIDEQPSLISHLQKRHDHVGKNLFEDENAWIALSGIFTDVLQDPSLRSPYLIIDGLDECMVDAPKLLDFIQKSSTSPRVKWIVSSRNDANIERRLRLDGTRLSLELKENAAQVSCAVDAYIDHCLSELTEIQYDQGLRDSVREKMQRKANGTFLWVSLIIKELKDAMSWEVLQILDDVPMELKDVYRRMMEQIKRLQRQYPELCRQVLSTVVTAYRPLRLQELCVLSGLPTQAQNVDQLTMTIVKMCGSFLTIRDDNVYIIHQSANDFLLDDASHDIFPRGIRDVHYSIFSKSIDVMSTTLRRDMYGLGRPGCTIELVKRPDADPLAGSRYSCIFWVDHLCDWKINRHEGQTLDRRENRTLGLQDEGMVDLFVRKTFLYWLEALSLCGGVLKGVLAMTKLEALVQDTENFAFRDLIRDARRFIMSNKQAIQANPLQVYASALAFSPSGSLLRRQFEHEMPKWITIKPAVGGSKWNTCLHVIEAHSSRVSSVTFSHDSALLASASQDDTVKLWDAGTGERLQTFEGHGGWVRSVAFSHDSVWLASGSHDRTVKIWDPSSGACLQTLRGHGHFIHSVAFSKESVWLASASRDCTVKVWDPSSGACLQTLNVHGSFVTSVAFSHDPAWRLASASRDGAVKIWDARSGKCLQTLRGHRDWVRSVAFSHDSAWLASASQDGNIRIWDASSGECLHTFEDHNDWVNSVAFSYDSTRRLASASRDGAVKIWDASSGKCLQTLRGHTRWANCVMFSRDTTRLASASDDGTIRIWDDSTISTQNDDSGEHLQTLEGHSNWVRSVVFSHDLSRLASGSNDGTIRVWHAAGSGECLLTLKGHSDWVRSVAFSHDSARLASSSRDCTIRIWDASSGQCLQTLVGSGHSINTVTFSHDSSRLASGSNDGIVRIWDATGSGECQQMLNGHGGFISSVAFSHDSTRLASASRDLTIRIWDATGSGECLQVLEGHRGWVLSVAFSRDLTRLASASDDGNIGIWDVADGGKCLQWYSIGKGLLSISFDATGSYLHTDIGTVPINAPPAPNMILDKNKDHGLQCQDLQWQGVGLSLNKDWITCNSENILYLPPEYRPSFSTVSGRTIAIGTGSGKVWMCSLEIAGVKGY